MRHHLPITGQTKIAGLIGWPVSHSVSPLMHNAAFDYLGLDWRYVPLPVDPQRPDGIRRAIAGLAALGMAGANVTVPHKQAVIPFVDRLLPAALAIGAVNTLIVEKDGSLSGDNTDAEGFVSDLREHGVYLDGQRVIVLGAGGSARAVVYGLARAGVERIAVLNRTLATAQELVAHLQPLAPNCSMSAFSLPQDLARLAPYADLIVNCTSLGMTPAVETTPWPDDVPLQNGQVVYDLVYNPPQTRLLQQAEQAGARPIGGLGMLVWQGALAFERWTGHPAPVDVMRGAAAAHLAAARRKVTGAKSSVSVRRAGKQDCAAISEINASIQRLHADVHPDFFKQPSATTFPPDYVAELIERPDTVMLVAETGGRVVGYLYGDVTPAMETSSTRAFDRFFIHHVAVAPHFQGTGCGTALVETAKQEARSRGIHRMALATWAFNQRALRFFEQQGFETYGYRMWMQGL